MPLRLLALPGLGLGEEAWAPTLTALGSSAVAVRMPGYGAPARRADQVSPRLLAALVDDSALPTLGTDGRTVVLGHSASCQVAAHVAARAPDRVAGLVLVGPTTDPRASTWPRMVRDWLATARRETPTQVPTLVRQYHRTGLASMRRAMNLARYDRIAGVLARVHCPVLVVRGVDDAICTPEWARTLVDLAPPGSEAVTLPAGAHMVPLTNGDLVAGAVSSFLARLAQPVAGAPPILRASTGLLSTADPSQDTSAQAT